MVAVASSLVIPATAQAGLHTRITDYPVGDGLSWPTEVAAGEFNGDGIIDLVIAGVWTGGGDFTVLLGTGRGAFSPAVVYGDSRFLSVATGDFDEDGLSDFALGTDTGGSGVVIELNNGDGTFDEVPIPTAPSASVAVADVDANGDLDVVAMTLMGVAVMRGDGDGGFADPAVYGTGIGGYGKVATGDINGDGRDDVVTAVTQGVGVLLAKPDGTLEAPRTTAVLPCCSMGFAVGDLNGDARDDVAATYAFDPSMSVFLAGADGTLGPPASTAFSGSSNVAMGDANRDGKRDLALSSFTGSVGLMFGRGNGTFDPLLRLPGGGQFSRPSAIDVNADGYDDLVMGDYRSNAVIVAINASVFAPSATRLDFGALGVGRAGADTPLVLRNDGLPPLSVASVEIAGSHAADFKLVGDDCVGRGLAGDEACSVVVRPEPAAGGARAAELVVASEAAETLRIPLSVTGLAPVPAAPVPAARDAVGPRVSLTVRRQRLGAALRSGLKARLGCDEACTVTARLIASRSVARRLKLPATRPLATTTARLAEPGTRAVAVKFTGRARRALRRARGVTLTLRVSGSDAAGNERVRNLVVRLRR